MTPTAGRATLNRSGLWVMTAPTSRPPLDPPSIPSLSLAVYFASIRYSAAAMKSSKTFCLFPNMPALCQVSPYSPPPRRLGSAKTTPCSSRPMSSGLKYGWLLMLNPP